jgi:hypothetical protein
MEMKINYFLLFYLQHVLELSVNGHVYVANLLVHRIIERVKVATEKSPEKLRVGVSHCKSEFKVTGSHDRILKLYNN